MAAVPREERRLVEVRGSKVHGLGVFATRRIPKGSRIIEYVGEQVSHDEADRRYEDKDENDSHTFLFIVDEQTVIDAGVDGNDARFINHSCEPNCESVIEERRVFIEAIRTIEPGTELTYDYQIQRADDDPQNADEVFACRCGFAACRGTMLWPARRPARASAAKKKTRSAAKSAEVKQSSAAKKRPASARDRALSNKASGKKSAWRR